MNNISKNMNPKDDIRSSKIPLPVCPPENIRIRSYVNGEEVMPQNKKVVVERKALTQPLLDCGQTIDCAKKSRTVPNLSLVISPTEVSYALGKAIEHIMLAMDQIEEEDNLAAAIEYIECEADKLRSMKKAKDPGYISQLVSVDKPSKPDRHQLISFVKQWLYMAGHTWNKASKIANIAKQCGMLSGINLEDHRRHGSELEKFLLENTHINLGDVKIEAERNANTKLWSFRLSLATQD